jgi:hydrogenase maturation protein HypF
MWGGEVLVATFGSFRRAATFRPLPLIGGDHAVRSPWRAALALVFDAFGTLPRDVRALFADVPDSDIELARRVLSSRLRVPMARGVGRYFDAFGALFLGRTQASFEGQTALEWNQAAAPSVTRVYDVRIDPAAQGYDEVDLRPAVRQAVAEYLGGEPVGAIAAAFHNTIAAATSAVVHRVVAKVGPLPVVASGGCFQNARLAESVRAALAPEHEVLLHAAVPPGDGGIALGQAVVADAIARA